MRLRPSIEKYAVPEQERRKRIARKSNWKFAPEVLAALEEAERIDGKPCAASPISIYERKESFEIRMRSLGYGESEAAFVTVVLGWAKIPAEKCSAAKILELKEKFQRYMRRISRDSSFPAFFMADFTFFKRLDGLFVQDRYDIQMHFHGVMHKADVPLLAYLKKTRGAEVGLIGSRPIMVKPVGCFGATADYCMKFAWQLKPTRLSPATGRPKLERGIQPPDKPALRLYRALSTITPKQLESRSGARNASRGSSVKKAVPGSATSIARNAAESRPRRRRRPLLLQGTKRFPVP